jgi:hypothetical protein
MKRIISLLILTIAILVSFPTKVLAETIKSFDTEIIAHKDGTFDVVEKINYDFEEAEKHGIFRDIPLVSIVGDLYRTIEVDFKYILKDGVPEIYLDQGSSKTASVKIGDKDKLITGTHLYTISYLVKNGIGSNYEDHDEIYWNITGNKWEIPIKKASANLTTDFGVNFNKYTCFTGASGSTNKDCNIDQKNIITTTDILNPSEGLTVVWGFPKDTFPPSILQKTSPSSSGEEISPFIILVIFAVPIFLNLILAPGLLIWYFKNKKKSRFGSAAVNFDFPEESGKRVAPAEAGSIDIHMVDQNDVIATIFDLAIRKYLKIEQIKKEDYKFTKLKEFEETMPAFELMLGSTLFAEKDSVELASLKKDFYITFQSFENDVFNSLVNRGFYSKNPKNQMILLLVAGIFSIFFGGIILGLILIFLSRILNGRTVKGDEMDFKIDGLKIFSKNMSREHTWYAKNLITVEKYIPYAIAFGFIKEFMEQLKVIYPNYNPSWYSGNTAFYLASNNMFNSMNSNFTTHAASSSSGFTGGSSGGGGGEGGGGSW